MGVLQQYEIAISHCCKRHDSLLGGALLLDASSSRCKCAAPSSSEAVRRTEIASSLRQSASWAKPFKGNHVVYSSTQWPFRTAVERPHRNRLCSTAVRNGNSVLVFSRFFRNCSDFLGRLQPSKTTIQKTPNTLGVGESNSPPKVQPSPTAKTTNDTLSVLPQSRMEQSQSAWLCSPS